MAHDVFISHSSKDKQIANAMCNKLESSGIRCWMAPRDIWPGRKWSEAIVHAIGESRLMLLIFSSNANTSDHIERELEIASNKRLPILPFRIEDVKPSGSLEYYLGTPHWLDALTPPLERHLNQLVESVKQLLQVSSRPMAPVPQKSQAPPAPERPPIPSGPEISARAPDVMYQIIKDRVPIELVRVPAGNFMMGSEKGNLMDRFMGDTKPVHKVTIGKSFYMGKYQVTQTQWQQAMGKNPSHFKGENLPVETVSWYDVIDFIDKLNAQNDGYTYRLPSEAEWEYAARAGTTGEYAGDLDAMAWYSTALGGNAGSQTHPVGSKLPNAFGLFDMHGNVWEWCQDWYHKSYSGAPTDGSAWLTGSKQKYRVMRGGSWFHLASGCRSAYRFRDVPGVHGGTIGLRVVAVART